MAAGQITDRALRYRANRQIPNHPKVCAFCGVRNSVEVGHVNGDESDDSPENLTWTCRSCNVLAANTLRAAGKGRLTNQYNPSSSQGATTVGEWMQAVAAITPHKGAKYSGRKYGLTSDMSVAEAVRIIRATPHSKRSEFASRLRRHNPMKNGWLDSDSDLIEQAKRERNVIELARLYKHAERTGDEDLADAVRERVQQLGLKQSDFQMNPARFQKRKNAVTLVPLGIYDVEQLDQVGRGIFKSLKSKNASKGTKKHRRKNPRNPLEDASDFYREFHGKDSEKLTEIVEELHEHTALAELGKLKELRVIAPDGGTVYVKGFEGALLCSDEHGKQLYIRGGDQSVDLREFGIESEHEIEVLGKIKQIRYFTEKLHLGEDGGKAEYYHDFGEEDVERGERARRPSLIYSTRDKLLSIVGGAYTIEPEGIAN